uniref:Uncharacterized protein LOC114339735 n=1 Tax=Diabrotica virgifera virgifera TaxID=50390 RepID=A0A6P7GLV6_DIAVI
MYGTPRSYQSQLSYSSADEYKTPEVSFNHRSDVFSQNFIELQKSSSTSVVERMKNNMLTVEDIQHRKSDTTSDREPTTDNRLSLKEIEKNRRNQEGVLRSKSEFEIPRMPVQPPPEKSFSSKLFSSESLFSFLTPRPKRKSISENNSPQQRHSPPNLFKVPNPLLKSLPETRTTSLSSLRSGHSANDGLSVQPVKRYEFFLFYHLFYFSVFFLFVFRLYVFCLPLALTFSAFCAFCFNCLYYHIFIGLFVLNFVYIYDKLFVINRNKYSSGLQLFIAKDGTAALGNHEVKSQMSTGVQGFKQVVMDNR